MNVSDLSELLIDYVAAYPVQHGQIAIWREPIMACAPADQRFPVAVQKLLEREVSASHHTLDLREGIGAFGVK